MGIRIFGLGAGAIILMLLWSLTLVLFTACLKVGRIIGAVVTLALAALISTILLVWPNASATRVESVEARKVDNVLLARLSLIVMLCIVLLISMVRFCRYHLAQSSHTATWNLNRRHLNDHSFSRSKI